MLMYTMNCNMYVHTSYLFKLTCLHRLVVLQDHMACKLCLMGSYLLSVKKITQLVVLKMHTSYLLYLLKCEAAC